jgi:hypothetical protein
MVYLHLNAAEVMAIFGVRSITSKLELSRVNSKLCNVSADIVMHELVNLVKHDSRYYRGFPLEL